MELVCTHPCTYIHIFSPKVSSRKHTYRNITKYSTNKTAYKCQIELYSVIPNFISRTIRHVLLENAFYGRNLKVLHKIITKEGCKREGIEDRAHSQINDTPETVLFMTYSLFSLLYDTQMFVYNVCS